MSGREEYLLAGGNRSVSEGVSQSLENLDHAGLDSNGSSCKLEEKRGTLIGEVLVSGIGGTAEANVCSVRGNKVGR